MSESGTTEVAEFVAQYVRSLDTLQVLICCLEQQERWWDAVTMARELGISQDAARRGLDQLARGNLLDIRLSDDIRYQYAPGTDTLRAVGDACLASYHRQPLQLIQLVRRASSNRARDFSDAFRIRARDDG
jgi:hypothetical protein